MAALGDISKQVNVQTGEGEQSLRVTLQTWPDISRAVPPLDEAQLIGIVTKAYAWVSG